ncbi:uncharacterized protein DSM5745_09393 [Aspergillus mulundensis]|uniref:Stress-response A/B barrel domain-containing protein n=1 Tax=Aspergillus mulundensis TaxID=1810919 RepID=A0A3D8QVW3_9EURO|nr:hypothetical protein DSM5745_09393 [Aspergillus mulundensis]RDW65654.1 hypothetical protein DSM5745_09393 [Aspergillus mulundensis]
MDSTLHRIPVGSTILVTGANGYIGSHVCNILLSLGYRVRGSVRSPKPWLTAFFDASYGRGRFEAVIIPCLSESEAWESAVDGVQGIAHVASDLSMNRDPEKVVPQMVQGVRNALEAAARHPLVKRVVYTSSSTAAFISVPNKEGVRITRDTWHDASIAAAWATDTPDDERGYQVYCASKTLAEKGAWEWVQRNKPHFEFSSVVPNTNYGRILCPEIPAPSMAWTGNLLHGDDTVMRSFPPQWFVDVEDTARLHVVALLSPSAVGKRLFAFAQAFNWTDILTILRELRPDNTQLPPSPENEGRDLSEIVDAPEAEALMNEFFGTKGWVGLKESLEAGLEGRWPSPLAKKVPKDLKPRKPFPMSVTHMVVFHFKESTSDAKIEESAQICREIIALKENCIHPKTQKPYIKSFEGGKDHSPENAQHGMTHGYVAQFESREDRDYYVSEDPVHLELGPRIAPFVEKFLCLDFTPEQWV